ncbi:MAG: nitrous oxide-stimulated promoter family protein [Rikenellaceae bacterium]
MKSRVQQDAEVIAAMVGIYCRSHHKTKRRELCRECRELLEYATKRLKKCPIEPSQKRSCRVCKIHCYDIPHTQRIGEVMRYSGPRMLLYNPVMAIRHLIQERKKI